MKEQSVKKRPASLWVILVLFVLSGGWSMQSVPLPGDQEAYLDNFNWGEYVLAQLQTLLGLAAVVALFLLRKAALPLAVACLWVNLLAAVWFAIRHGFSAFIQSAGVSLILNWCILVAVIIYTFRLHQSGQLR